MGKPHEALTPSEAVLNATLDLYRALGEPMPIGKRVWRHTVDDHWKVMVNATDDVIDHVPPFYFAYEFNGWPFAMLHPEGSGLAGAGQAANLDTLHAALLRAFEVTRG